MAIYYRNKLYKNEYIDLRDYERADALKRKKDILIVLQDPITEKIIDKMTLTVAQLKKEKLIKERNTVMSKIYPGQRYTILSYDWLPDKELNKEEQLKQYFK